MPDDLPEWLVLTQVCNPDPSAPKFELRRTNDTPYMARQMKSALERHLLCDVIQLSTMRVLHNVPR